MSRRTRGALTTLVIGVGILGFLLVSRSADKEVAPTSPLKNLIPRDREGPNSIDSSTSQSNVINKMLASETVGSEVMAPVAIPPEPDWKRADPLFHEFHRLEALVFRSKENEEMYRAYLSQPLLFARSAEIIRTSAKTDERIFAIDFLNAAVSWKENPVRNEALKVIEGVALSKINKEAGVSVQEQVADRVEAMMILIDHDLKRATAALAKSQTEEQRRLVQYAFEIGTRRLKELSRKESAKND